MLLAECRDLPSFELLTVVSDDRVRDPQSAYEVLPHEFDHLLFSDFG